MEENTLQPENNRLIVTGQMRSGTTMLCSFLNGQEGITTYQDLLRVAIAAQIKLRPAVQADQLLTDQQKKTVLDELIRLTLTDSGKPDGFRGYEWEVINEIKEKSTPVEFKDLAELYHLLLNRLAVVAGAPTTELFGTKVTRSEAVARVCAKRGMKAIIILRDPRAAFVSHFVRAQKDPTFKVNTSISHFISAWRESYRIWKASPNALNIRYEDFVVDQTLGGRLADYLNREIDPNVDIKTGNSSFGDKSTGKVRPVAVDRWREHAQPEHIIEIMESLAKEMVEVGYL